MRNLLILSIIVILSSCTQSDNLALYNTNIEVAKKAAVHEGYSSTEIQRWIDDEQTKTLATVTQIKNTIEVRNFD